MDAVDERLRQVVADFTGSAPAGVRRLGGGDAAAAHEVALQDGRTVFAKSAPADMPGATAAEAASLRWLADAGSVPVPAVHGHDERWLVTEHIRPATPGRQQAEEFGRGLARLHAAGAPAHGCPPPGGPTDAWIGGAPMRNEPASDWCAFYATHRIEPYLRRLLDDGTLDRSEAESISLVCERMAELAGPPEEPARLHGDLWSGNVHWGETTGPDVSAAGSVWLIDPAAHGGHRETDLAMLQLFGCPHLEHILTAYQEVHPLADGWRDRVGLHQLFPLLVHGVLFGRGYAGRAVAVAREAVSGVA